MQQIDSTLAAWNNRLAAIAKNLLDLQAEPTYQALTGSGGAAKLTLKGQSAARVEPVLRAMISIFEHFGLLHETIDRATKVRKSLPSLFGADQKMREIEHLLFATSVRLPTDDLPLEERTLLSGVQKADRITPEALLSTMMGAFTTARDTVLAVEEAWSEAAREIDGTEARISNLAEQAHSLGLGAFSSLREAEELLKSLRGRVQPDPFGALNELKTAILPLIAQCAGVIETAERTRLELLRARDHLSHLEQLHRETLVGSEEVRAKIADCAALPSALSGQKLGGLRDWLARLDCFGDPGRNGVDKSGLSGSLNQKRLQATLDSLAVGLRQWNMAVEECVTQERKVGAASRALLEARAELRGRLDALKAKARARGVAERDAVTKLASQAEALLYAQPTDLAQAADAVAGYQRAVSSARAEV